MVAECSRLSVVGTRLTSSCRKLSPTSSLPSQKMENDQVLLVLRRFSIHRTEQNRRVSSLIFTSPANARRPVRALCADFSFIVFDASFSQTDSSSPRITPPSKLPSQMLMRTVVLCPHPQLLRSLGQLDPRVNRTMPSIGWLPRLVVSFLCHAVS